MSWLRTLAADAAAMDWCTAVPDLDVPQCCTRHDDAYEFGSRWRIDRKLSADLDLGWCALTATPREGSRWGRWYGILPYHVGHIFLGLAYGAGTALLGWPWWVMARSPTRRTRQWGARTRARARARALQMRR